MDTEREKLAKKYSKIKITVGITEGIISFILMILFVWLGFSKELEMLAYGYTSNPYLALLLFGVIIGVVSIALSFPIDYVFGFRLEKQFGLSNQTFAKWVVEKLKSGFVAGVFGLPIALMFFFLIRNYELWWLYLACIVWLYSVLLAQIAPIVIFPIFYKQTPIENESIKNRIMSLCENIGFKISGVFTFDMSKNTKKANAAFMGIGKSRRIVIGDTLISGFSEDEIETVFAHELGHFKKGHIKKGVLLSSFMTFAGLFVLSSAYNLLYPKFGFASPSEIGALPLLAVIGSVWGLISMPIGSSISRRFEYEADRFAIETTRDLPTFKSTMEKLAFQNLADTEPNELIEFWIHSHPSMKKRIAAGEKYYREIAD